MSFEVSIFHQVTGIRYFSIQYTVQLKWNSHLNHLKYSNGKFGGQATLHHNVYSSIGGGGNTRSQHGSKNSSMTTSALALLAFLFFIHILQNCLKEQMVTSNPTVESFIFKRNRIVGK